MDIVACARSLSKEINRLHFGSPVEIMYNPLDYAREPHEEYCRRYGNPEKEVLLVGMNPGPFGMGQTGVPFGAIDVVKGWLKIEGRVDQPATVHPRRPVTGFSTTRNEVSGSRLWGWARKRFETPDSFFSRFFVYNYCPLLFFDHNGKNITPDKIARTDRDALYVLCDKACNQTAAFLKVQKVIGIGSFAAGRVAHACEGLPVRTGRITHPSPANPRANRGWEPLIEKEFAGMGIS